MAAITDLSDLVNRMTGGGGGAPECIFWFKSPRIAGVAGPTGTAGKLASLWLFDGMPSAGITPTTVANPTVAMDGGLKQTNPAGGTEKWLLQMGAIFNTPGVCILYDRLLHIGGLSGTTITAQTVGGTLTRNTTGKGNMVFVEIYTAVGTTITTISMSYTNQAGASGRTSPTTQFGGTGFREQARAIQMPLMAGDTGVQAVASVTVAASTLTAGNFGVTIAKPIATVATGAGQGGWTDFITGLPGLPKIDTDACLAMMYYPATSGVPEAIGALTFVEK